MKLGHALPLAVLLMMCALLNANDYASAAAKTITIDIADAEPIDVTIPAGWSVDRVQSNPSLPPSIRLHPKGNTASLQITFFSDRFGNLNTRPKVDAAAKKASLQYVGGSMERELRLRDLKSGAGIGAIAEFTDARYATREPAPGQFKIVGSGLVHLGQCVASFTLMGNGFEDPAYVAAKEVLISGVNPHKKPNVAVGRTIRR